MPTIHQWACTLGVFEAPPSGPTVDCRWRGRGASVGWRIGTVCPRLLVPASWCVGAREQGQSPRCYCHPRVTGGWVQAQHSQEPGELLGCCLRGVSTEILHELWRRAAFQREPPARSLYGSRGSRLLFMNAPRPPYSTTWARSECSVSAQ